MAQTDWDGVHAVYARGPEARSYGQGHSGYGQYGQYGRAAQYYSPQGHAPDAVDAHEPDLEAPAQPALADLLAKGVTLLGGVVSLALLLGLGVWGYKLAMRDVTGIPVVRALEGPMRIRPDDPGGMAVAHQGLAVNAVAAAGGAAASPEEVTLAPAPIALEAEDAPVRDETELSAAVAAEAGDVPALSEAVDAAVAVATETSFDAVAEQDAVEAALAMANALAAAAEPLSGEAADLSMTAEAEATFAAATVPASVPGVAISPRPVPRPEALVTRAAMSPADMVPVATGAVAATSATEVAAATIPTGTRLVQLGAFDSEAVARAEWDKLAAQFSDVLDGKSRVIEQAQSGGKTFYRLRAMGFDDLSDARRFCAALMAGQAACIPVVTR